LTKYYKNCRERQKYEKQITEVSQELEAMRLSVLELLEENEKLPESERIDRHEFELVRSFGSWYFITYKFLVHYIFLSVVLGKVEHLSTLWTGPCSRTPKKS
jgi:hypothetical protein